MGKALEFLLGLTPEQRLQLYEVLRKADRKARKTRRAEQGPHWITMTDGGIDEVGMPVNGDNRAMFNLGDGCSWKPNRHRRW